jgi:hypothetical protein
MSGPDASSSLDDADDGAADEISEVDSVEQFVEMSRGATRDETLKRRQTLRLICDVLSATESLSGSAELPAPPAPVVQRKNTELVQSDVAFRDSASLALLVERADSGGAASPMPLVAVEDSTLRATPAAAAEDADVDADVLDLLNPADRGAVEPVPVVVLSVRWRRVVRRVRVSTTLSVADALGMFVRRCAGAGLKATKADALALVRRQGDDVAALDRKATVGALALSGAELAVVPRKCDECAKERIAACVTKSDAGGAELRLFLCRLCATVAGVKQLKVQQMLLVGQIGELELKLKRTSNASQIKKLNEALRLAKARHRGVQDDIAALAPDLPKTTTVPVLRRSSTSQTNLTQGN